MIDFLSSLKLNEIHKVDSLFDEDPKIYFFPGRNGRKIQLKWRITGTSIVMQIGGGQFRKRISAPTLPLVPKSLRCLNFPTFQIKFLGKKNEKTQFSGQNLTFPPPLSKY